jgi:hypothetical protein
MNTMALHARICERSIQVYYSGKWRSLRYYQGQGIPSKKIIEEAMGTFMLNSGYSKLPKEQQPVITLTWTD